MLYHFDYDKEENLLTVGFGEQADGDAIVREVAAKLVNLRDEVISGHQGRALRVTGPASVAVAYAIAHALGHMVPALAQFDPRLGKYIVAISHSPKYAVGDLLD